jgi:hypothetical protein
LGILSGDEQDDAILIYLTTFRVGRQIAVLQSSATVELAAAVVPALLVRKQIWCLVGGVRAAAAAALRKVYSVGEPI